MPSSSAIFHDDLLAGRVVLITGGAHRVGAATARRLHAAGARLMVHYRSSESAAQALQAELNAVRADSVALVQADLLDIAGLPELEPVPSVSYRSGGQLLIVGPAEAALHWAGVVAAQLSVTVLITGRAAGTELPATRDFPVFSGEVTLPGPAGRKKQLPNGFRLLPP